MLCCIELEAETNGRCFYHWCQSFIREVSEVGMWGRLSLKTLSSGEYGVGLAFLWGIDYDTCGMIAWEVETHKRMETRSKIVSSSAGFDIKTFLTLTFCSL